MTHQVARVAVAQELRQAGGPVPGVINGLTGWTGMSHTQAGGVVGVDQRRGDALRAHHSACRIVCVGEGAVAREIAARIPSVGDEVTGSVGGEETVRCIVSVRRDGSFGKSGGLGHRRAVAHGVVGVGVVLARRACRERSRTVVSARESVQRVVGVGAGDGEVGCPALPHFAGRLLPGRPGRARLRIGPGRQPRSPAPGCGRGRIYTGDGGRRCRHTLAPGVLRCHRVGEGRARRIGRIRGGIDVAGLRQPTSDAVRGVRRHRGDPSAPACHGPTR